MLDLLKELLLYSTFFVCFFSFINLWAGGFKENKSKLALSLYMLGSAIFFAFSILRYLKYYQIYINLESIHWGLLLSSFPLLYIYIRSLLVNKWFHKKLLLHFTQVFVIGIVATFLYIELDYSEKIHYLNNSGINDLADSRTIQNLDYVFKISTYIYLIQGIFYFLGIYLFYRKYKLKIRNLYSDQKTKELKRLESIIYLILIMVITNIITVNFIGLNKIWNNDLSFILVSIFITFSFGFLGILGAKQKNIYAAETMIKNQDHVLNNPIEELKNKLLYQFNEKKIYLKKDLNIWDVCLETNSNRTYISHLINTELGLNFNCFVNKYRVDEAKKLLINPDFADLSIQTIADRSGFNSLASFNRAFGKFEKMSPGKFRKEISN
ncbi:MAG: helix-turn-helix domain-containing protein [Bacteroidota bacterium]